MVFEAFNVPLIDKQGAEPKRYDFFEETFLNMCQLKREQGIWWLEIGGIRRRDDEAEGDNNDAPATNEEVNQEENFDWEVVIDEVDVQEEEVNEETEIQGESGSVEKFYDAEDEIQGSADVIEEILEVHAPVSAQQKETTALGVEPSTPTGCIPYSVFLPLQAELERARANRI
ncbi:hypothetical protein Dimus_031781 [Dionaea muscipula]